MARLSGVGRRTRGRGVIPVKPIRRASDLSVSLKGNMNVADMHESGGRKLNWDYNWSITGFDLDHLSKVTSAGTLH